MVKLINALKKSIPSFMKSKYDAEGMKEWYNSNNYSLMIKPALSIPKFDPATYLSTANKFVFSLLLLLNKFLLNNYLVY